MYVCIFYLCLSQSVNDHSLTLNAKTQKKQLVLSTKTKQKLCFSCIALLIEFYGYTNKIKINKQNNYYNKKT